jgi:RimJ/RimL family protein N-acetyltransferase
MEQRPPFYLAVEARDAGKVVGTLGFLFTDPAFNQAELTLSSNKAACPPGLELEALRTALGLCFRELNLHRVIAQCGTSDSECRQLFKELGMRQEAEFVKHRFVGSEWLSTNWFAMLEEEYSGEPTA